MLSTIAQFREAPEAHLAKGKLAAEGIEAEIYDEHVVGINWLYSNAVGGVKLVVVPDLAPRAAAALQAHLSHAESQEDPLPRLPLLRAAGAIAILVLAMWVPTLVVCLPLIARDRWHRRLGV